MEYVGLTGLKIMQWDPFMKQVYCTTGTSFFFPRLAALSSRIPLIHPRPRAIVRVPPGPSMFTASARKTLMERNCSAPVGGAHGGHRRCRRGNKAAATAVTTATAAAGAAPPAVAVAVAVAGTEDEEAGLLTGYRLASRDFIQEGGVFKAVRVTKVRRALFTAPLFLSHAPCDPHIASRPALICSLSH
jgi:hypothetical protein